MYVCVYGWVFVRVDELTIPGVFREQRVFNPPGTCEAGEKSTAERWYISRKRKSDFVCCSATYIYTYNQRQRRKYKKRERGTGRAPSVKSATAYNMHIFIVNRHDAFITHMSPILTYFPDITFCRKIFLILPIDSAWINARFQKHSVGSCKHITYLRNGKPTADIRSTVGCWRMCRRRKCEIVTYDHIRYHIEWAVIDIWLSVMESYQTEVI